MDLLKAEITNKRKELVHPSTDSSRPTKYMRRSDLERLKQEQELQEKAKNREEKRSDEQVKGKAREDSIQSNARVVETNGDDTTNTITPDASHPSTSTSRAQSERSKDTEQEKKNREEKEKVKRNKEKEEMSSESLDLELVKTDPNKLYPIIYFALKRALKEWEQWMDERPELVKRTAQGKLAATTQQQSGEYLKPLLKLLRARNLPADVLARIAEIVHYMQKRQYQKANDSYLQLSIGNAPWPIGVTMVGIHERSAREKISANQVAHVLNDEVSRKYIQSLKRILTFAQTKYPPEDVTQLMG